MSSQKLYYEDLNPGLSLETAKRTITQEDLETFTRLSGDYNPLHTDADYAATTAFGGLIVQGALVLSIATGLASSLGYLNGTVEAFVGLDWKYRGPVKVGDTIWATLRVDKKHPMPGYNGGLVTVYVTIFNQDHKAVQKGTWTLLVRSQNRDASPTLASVTRP
ncbi:MAG TPA: MaoC/PaaZ C-terminal domain-containing protein [Anaerolineae bacterium]|nr:MaoC/PaaZ C-terminal domain-containing protein [Anaerolineae bacterium]HQH38323.1 MaoC/PaaZ C-terminal domain-containing protein [Anaerolineae bacterium]